MDIKKLKIDCHIMVISMVGKQLAREWWDRPNKFFNMKTPNEIWENNPKAVYDYIVCCANNYS